MNLRNLLVVLVVMFIILIIFFSNPSTCSSIGNCKECWSNIPKVRECEGNETCFTDPEIEKYNALIDLMLCACDQAKENGYDNSEVNNRIESLYSSLMGYNLDVQEICGSDTVPLIKKQY